MEVDWCLGIGWLMVLAYPASLCLFRGWGGMTDEQWAKASKASNLARLGIHLAKTGQDQADAMEMQRQMQMQAVVFDGSCCSCAWLFECNGCPTCGRQLQQADGPEPTSA